MKRMLMDYLVVIFPVVYHQPILPLDCDANSVWTDVSKNRSQQGLSTDLIVFIFETESSYIGKEVGLNLSRYQNVQVLGFHSVNPLLKEMKLPDSNWPVVGYIDKSLSVKSIPLAANEDLVPYIVSSVLTVPGTKFILPSSTSL